MALVQADARQRHGRLDSLADALMQILLHSGLSKILRRGSDSQRRCGAPQDGMILQIRD